MDVDIAALQRFSEVPLVIEGPAFAGGLAAASARAMSRLQVTLDPKGLSEERYRSLVARLQSDIDGRLGQGSAYRIDVIDRTKGTVSEERRIDPHAVGFTRSIPKRDAGGAFSTPYQGRHGMACLVLGFPANFDVESMMSSPIGPDEKVPVHGLNVEDFHWFSMRHELGHCLLGNSESRAETFAALMAIRDGRLDSEGIAQLARYREASEWANPDVDDDHYVSAALWEVVKRADALKASPRFMAMTMEEVAETARSLSDRYGLNASEMSDAMTVRRGLIAAMGLPFHEVAKGSGHVSLGHWAEAHADIPELGRLTEAMEALATGEGRLAAFRFDMGDFKASMEGLAHAGDRTAATILRGMAHHHHVVHEPPDFAEFIPVARDSLDIDAPGLANGHQGAVEVIAPTPAGFGMR